ncbi:MAG: phosphonate ABC transporter ATP-binding protein, partial [Ilumatobacter sp.]
AQVAGRVDLAQYGPFSYVIAKNAGADIDPVGALVETPDEEPGYQSYGITRADNAEINTLADFAGRSVCFVDPGSTSGFLYPSAGLIAEGIDPESGVSPIFAGGHDASVISVNNGDCEAGFAFDAMVDNILIESGDIEEGAIKTVWESEVIAGSPIAVNLELPESLVEEIRRIVLEEANTDRLLERGICEDVETCGLTDENSWGWVVWRTASTTVSARSAIRPRLHSARADVVSAAAAQRTVRADADSIVRLSGLSKQFPNGPLALDTVTFSVPRGQLLCLIGLSGSGKSTLLRHLNGLHHPTRGEVEVMGLDVVRANRSQLRALRREVGFVFQQFGLVGRLSCLENVLSGALGRLRGPRLGTLSYSTPLRRQALEHLDRVGLADRAFQRSDTLSGGQMQRVAIARTLMQQPTLLLADEPVASLDPESSAHVMDVLFRIVVEDQLTVICTLHQVELAMGWANRIVGLRDGQMVLDRAVTDLAEDEVMDVYRRVDPDGATPITDTIEERRTTGARR